MDKGGDEHLVALQRLENEFAALDTELSRVDQELSLDQRYFSKKSDLRIEIDRSQVYTEQILEMKPYWMAADTDSLNQLAQTAERITQLFAGEEYASPQRGKSARKNVIAKIAALQDHRKLLLRGRYELSAAMVKFILAEDSQVPESDFNWNVKPPGHELDAVHAGYVRRNQMRQMDARANLLSATSSYVFETRERPSQPAMVDIVTFAAQHFDDEEIEPEAFESRTEELKALVASPKSL